MAEIVRKAAAGTLESSDVYVEIAPGESGIDLELESGVQEQFGQAIEQVVRQVLREQGVTCARIRLVDRGALDCVIRARVETAIVRGGE